MGFLKKTYKRWKKGIKKFGKRMKKSFKKLNAKKILKIAAIVGAALVMGGSFLTAFPQTAANNVLAQKIVSAGQWVQGIPFLGKAFVPFSKAGAFLGETAYAAGARMGFIDKIDVAKKTLNAANISMTGLSDAEIITKANEVVTGKTLSATLTADEIAELGSQEILGGTSAQAATFAGPAGSTAPLTKPAATVARTGGRLLGSAGAFAGNLVGDVVTSVAGGYLAQKFLGQEDGVGAVGPGQGDENALNKLNDVEVAYTNADVDINDAYSNMTYGTADLGYLSRPLFNQSVLGVT